MAGVTTEELRDAIADILKGADLTELSAKKVRKKLEEQFEEDFTSRKKEIDDLVMTAITASQKSSQSDDDDDEGSKDEDSDSACSDEPTPKKQKSSAPSPPAKKQKTKDSSSGSESELDDEALARKLQEEERLPRRRAAAKKVTPRKRNTKKDDSGKPKIKRENMYSKKCVLSESLAEVVGAKEMARSDVVKKMWEVVRERNLFDPKNKRYVICDEQLQKVFGNQKRVLIFGMMKYLKSHIIDAHRL